MDSQNSQPLWTNNPMDVFSLDRHLDHDYILGIPDELLRTTGIKRSLQTLPTLSVTLWKYINSEEKQNKSIYLLKLKILKHPENCAKECLVGKKRKDEPNYLTVVLMNLKVVTKQEKIN